jgi:hypothetical protein
MTTSFAALFALVISPRTARADLIVTSPPDQSIPEGDMLTFTFAVTNNGPNAVVLTMARCEIHKPAVPDDSDFIVFAGNNGNMGLVGFAAVLLPGQTGDFTFRVMSDTPEPGTDFGKNPVTFDIIMEDLLGPFTIMTNPTSGRFELIQEPPGPGVNKMFGHGEFNVFVFDIPEPPSILLLGIGTLSLVGFWWHRRKLRQMGAGKVGGQTKRNIVHC